jgi:ferredoxin
MQVSKRIVLHYPPALTERPIIYELVKKYDIMFNILRADFSVDGAGMLLLELTGEKRNLSKSFRFLRQVGLRTELLSQDIERSEEQCVHCGVCAMICPAGAFLIIRPKMLVELRPARCIGCEECVKVCPYHAIKISFI